MSKLDELINKLCPNGVSYFYLGELEDSKRIALGRGMIISKIEMSDNPGPYPVYSSSSINNGMIGTYGKYMFDDERLTWSIDGGGKFFYRNNEKYSVTNVGGWLKVIDKNFISTRYLYHVISSQLVSKTFDYTHKAHPSVIRDEYRVPVPPMEVQCEIVRILDNFTELTAEISTLLSIELVFRRKQYEHYREELFLNNSNYPYLKFADTCDMKAGKAIKSDLIFESKEVEHSYPCFGGNGIRGYVSTPNIHGEYPIIGRQGALCGNVNYASGDFYATEHAVVVTSKGRYLQRYLFHLLTFMNLNKYKSQGAQPGLAVKNLLELSAFVPTIKVQRKVVSILDASDAYLNDLTSSLHAEIEARQKQYEYYRDKLLKFKELKA